MYPANCVQTSCPRLYAHEDAGVTWVGCIDGVFTAQVDLDALLAMEAVNPGFGALRAEGAPRPECRAAIDRTFPARDDEGCTEPGFRAAHPDAPQGREPVRLRRRA